MQMIDTVEIRVVRLSDAPHLQQNCFIHHTVEQVRERVRASLDAYSEGLRIPLVAEVKGVVVGQANLARNPHPLRRHRASIDDIAVNSPYNGPAIVRKLVHRMRELAVPAGVTILEASVRGGSPAEDLYRRMGFCEYGRLPKGIVESPGGDGALEEVFLWLPVTRV